MNKKGKLLSVTNIRSFNTQNGTKWAVTFEVQWDYYKRDGSKGTQGLLADYIYDHDPGYQIGPLADDGKIYDMQFAFNIREKDGRKFLNIAMTNCSIGAL